MATIVGDVTGPQQLHRLSTRVKSFEILQHIENSNGWEGGIRCGSMNLHARPRVKSQTFFSFLDGAQLFLATDVTNHVPCLTSSYGLSSRVCRVYPEDCWGSKSKKKKKAILQSRSKSCERRSWLVTRGPPLLQVSDYTWLQKRLFIDKQVIITGPAVPLGTRLLDLGSKLFPSTIQRMLNNSLTRFMHNHLK